MRTHDEIVAKINSIAPEEFFGFRTADLVEYLPFPLAKQFLKEEATEDLCSPAKALDRDSILKEMHDYMAFAWGKANDERGLSAGRSIEHYSIWLWLLGEDELSEGIRDYDQYGKPQLRQICEKFGWDWNQWSER